MPRKKLPAAAGAFYGNPLGRIATMQQKESKPKYRGMAMSVEDMADELAIGRNIAYQLVQQPDFPSFMIGRRVLVSRKGLQEWIDGQCKKGPDGPEFQMPPSP